MKGSLRILGGCAVLAVAGSITTAGAQGATSSYIPSQQTAPPTCGHLRPIADAFFPKQPTAKNKWLPMAVGTRYVLEGRANRTGTPTPHSITFTVTGLTKVINGVRTRVLWDVDVNSGVLVESELSFFAEDGRGNIWLYGEYPEEYETGYFKGAPNTWLGGSLASEPGVIVPAYPKLSGPSYIQAFAPSVGFFDCGKDIMKQQTACVPIGCFTDVLVVEEWNPNDPAGGFQRKYYAPHVGNIQVGAVNDPEGETLVMGSKRKLTKTELQQADAEALKLDERAYLVSDVYRGTEPAQPGGKVPPIPPPPVPTTAAPVPTGTVPAVVSGSQAVKPKAKKRKKAKRCASKRKHGAKGKAKAKAKAKSKAKSKRKRCGSKRRKSSK
jgi:hypothetical protein